MKPNRIDPETLSLIEGALDRFVDAVGDLTARRKRLAAEAVDERLHWQALAGIGVFGIAFTESAGGLGGSAADIADCVRLLSRGLLLEPWIESAVLAGALAQAAGPCAAELLDAVQSGARVVVPVGGRLGRSDAITCVRSASGWRVSGSVDVVPGAACADDWLIVTRDAEQQVRVLRAQPASVKVRRRDHRLMDGRSASDIVFDDVLLPETASVIHGAAAVASLERLSTLAAVAYCADAVGTMQQLVNATREYLGTRLQFGVPISSFQVLQHRLADMQMAWLEARAISAALAACADEDDLARQAWLRCAAVSVVGRAAPKVAHEAIQMHGGMGVTEELAVGHHNARLVVLVKLLQAWVPAVSPLSVGRKGPG